MKSIMEEASSIMEAIQKGWERAGKPQEFSVKIFEDAQTAFFGMRTVKSAKIALFFKEGGPSLTPTTPEPNHRPARNQQFAERQPNRHAQTRPTEDRRASRTHQERAPRPEREEREFRKPIDQSKPQAKPRELQEERTSNWNDEMASWVNSWIKEALQSINRSDITFTSEMSRNHLRIDFSNPITGDEKKERIFFSSLAHLIMSSLRNKFKGDLKHLKVILNSK